MPNTLRIELTVPGPRGCSQESRAARVWVRGQLVFHTPENPSVCPVHEEG